MGNKSQLETIFWDRWAETGLPAPIRNFNKWDRDTRRELDFAWMVERVAVEIQGGAFTGGKHGRGAGITADLAKLNRAAELGWTVLAFTSPQVRDRGPDGAVEVARRVLGQRWTAITEAACKAEATAALESELSRRGSFITEILDHVSVMTQRAVRVKHNRRTPTSEADRAQGQADFGRVILSLAREQGFPVPFVEESELEQLLTDSVMSRAALLKLPDHVLNSAMAEWIRSQGLMTVPAVEETARRLLVN